MKAWKPLGPPRLERFRADDFSILKLAGRRKTRQTGPNRKRVMLH